MILLENCLERRTEEFCIAVEAIREYGFLEVETFNHVKDFSVNVESLLGILTVFQLKFDCPCRNFKHGLD